MTEQHITGEKKGNIFYLTFNEVKDVVESGVMTAEYRSSLSHRKEEIGKYRHVTLPGLIVGNAPPIPTTGVSTA